MHDFEMDFSYTDIKLIKFVRFHLFVAYLKYAGFRTEGQLYMTSACLSVVQKSIIIAPADTASFQSKVNINF
jgi:hypothetical protein